MFHIINQSLFYSSNIMVLNLFVYVKTNNNKVFFLWLINIYVLRTKVFDSIKNDIHDLKFEKLKV